MTLCTLQAIAADENVQLAQKNILVVGDSLSAAYGIDKPEGWVSLLEKRLQASNQAYRVINASITGDTTLGGLNRLESALERTRPEIVIIELGGNDGLRGFGLQHTRENLRSMIDLSHDHGSRVLLLGVKLPSNYGKSYGERFHRIYQELAEEEQVAVVPFFLEGVAETLDMMQPDGIHPAAVAQPRILENVWTGLEPLLDEG